MSRRFIDFVGSGVLLLLAAPIFLVAGIAIWSVDRGPIFYRQTRVELRGNLFQLLKFRSMRVNQLSAVAVGQVREDHPMVTSVGR